MERSSYIKQSSIILERLFRLEIDFYSLVSEYYRDSPREKGKEDTPFFIEMNSLIDGFERSSISMRDKLKDPDSIQGYDTK